METQGEIDEKQMKNILRKNISEFEQSVFLFFLFSIKITTNRKNSFSKILDMFRDIGKNIKRKFLFFNGFSSISQ